MAKPIIIDTHCVKDNDELWEIRFEPISWVQSVGRSVESSNYDLIYTDSLACAGSTSEKLNALWDRFINDNLLDFRGHNLSVSEIVALKRNDVVSCHYVDRFGFQELPAFLKPENYLKNAEIAMEDDYGICICCICIRRKLKGKRMNTLRKQKTKIKYFLVFTIILSLLLAGCSNQEKLSVTVASPIPIMEESHSSGEPIFEPQSDYLKTSGGAVLVGKVGKNEDGGYCLKLDGMITVELTGSVDHPELFENCEEVLLYGQSEDGIDKSSYEDMDVTIKGILQNDRGTGRLYVYVCDIWAERTTEKCYADESIEIGQSGWIADYDPSKPLPEKMQPVIKNGAYAFNPYTLKINTLRHFGNDFANFYVDFVDAFLNYETSCYCPNQYYADMFPAYVTSDFYLFTGDGEIGAVTSFDESTSTLHWTYTSRSKEQHDEIIRNFENEINKYLSHVSPADSGVVKAEKLYHYFCASLTYNYEAAETRDKVEPYYAFTEHKGICYTFAGGYSYLLSMVGIENDIVNACIEVGEEEDELGHVWNIVLLNGENYFCDPTYEVTSDSGSAYAYFGMTLEDRLNDNTKWIMDSMWVGTYDSFPIDQVELAASSLHIVPRSHA